MKIGQHLSELSQNKSVSFFMAHSVLVMYTAVNL